MPSIVMLAIVLFALASLPAAAQTTNSIQAWPTKPVTMVVTTEHLAEHGFSLCPQRLSLQLEGVDAAPRTMTTIQYVVPILQPERMATPTGDAPATALARPRDY